MFDKLDLKAIQDENARELIGQLMNLVEKVSADLRDAQVENQRLRDENNRLKGEQGKPKYHLNKSGKTRKKLKPIKFWHKLLKFHYHV